jgi:hypothetical protein
MLVYYCYRQKRDNPNDAFGRKNENIKDADGLRQAVISDLLKTISEQWH